MIELKRKSIELSLRGATLFGTGGGGSYSMGLSLAKGVRKVKTLEKEDINPSDVFITSYLVGPIGGGIDINSIFLSINTFQSIYRESIKGIMFGEVGAGIFGMNYFISDVTGIPIVDIDVAGGRSVPLIDTEMYSIFNLSRFPLVVASGKNALVIKQMRMDWLEERIERFRQDEKVDFVVVTGYPTKGETILKFFPFGITDKCLQIGKSLERGKEIPHFEKVDTGI